MKASRFSHEELVRFGIIWLRAQKYHPVLAGIASCDEIPDVIGWKSQTSCVIECKTSVADFKNDRKKYHVLKHPNGWPYTPKTEANRKAMIEKGYQPHEIPRMGMQRYYLSEPDIVTVEMVKDSSPDHGLIHVINKKNRVVLPAPMRKENVAHRSEIRYLRFALVHLSDNLGKRGIRCNLLKATLFFGDNGIEILPYARILI